MTTLFMIGLVANAARHEPAAVAALRAGQDDKVNRLLRLPQPEPYLPSRVEALRDRLRSRPAAGKPATLTKPAKLVKPVKAAKPVKPGKPARADRPAPDRVGPVAKGGTAQRARGHAGHHGGASQQRHAGAAQGHAGHVRQGSGRPRRSRPLEGQRYG